MDIDFDDAKPVIDKDDTPVVEPKKTGVKPTLLIVRHGNTFEADEPPRRVGGKTDIPLTSEGRAQLVRLAAHIEQAGLKPQRVYTGPLQRTIQSALAFGPSYEILEFLREIYHGIDENKTEDIVLKNVGRAALEAWDREGKLPLGWTADILAIRQGWAGLKKLCRDNGGIWAAVTSNGIARFAFDDVEEMPENRKLRTGSFGVLVYDVDRWVCKGWNLRP